MGLVDSLLPNRLPAFEVALRAQAQQLAADPLWIQRVQHKQRRRAQDEKRRPLAAYRSHELTRMWGCFFAPDSEYHEARCRFVHKQPPLQTPLHIAKHRRPVARIDDGVTNEASSG